MAEIWKDLSWTTPELITASDLNSQADNTLFLIEGQSSHLLYNHMAAVQDGNSYGGSTPLFLSLTISINGGSLLSHYANVETSGWEAVTLQNGTWSILPQNTIYELEVNVVVRHDPLPMDFFAVKSYVTQPRDCKSVQAYFEYKLENNGGVDYYGIRNLHVWTSRYNWGQSP